MTSGRDAVKLGILGRERMLVIKLAKLLNRSAVGHQVTKVYETPRGAYFDVLMYDGPESSNRVARVTVEFDRLEDGPSSEAIA
jgi:hypothetical protein